MPVSVADLIDPVGPVQPDMFPKDTRGDEATVGTLEHRLRGYLTDAESRVAAFIAEHPDDLAEGFDGDAAVRAWASYRAFAARFIALSSSPANATLTDQGGRSYIKDQILAFQEQAQDYRDEYKALLANAVIREGTQKNQNTGTTAVKMTYGL